jgi:hypothetical protein
MLINRRTYRILSGHWDTALALMKEIRQETRVTLNSDWEIQTPRYGPHQTLAVEFAFGNESEMSTYFHGSFYPMLQKYNWLDGWFSHVDHADSLNFKTQVETEEDSTQIIQSVRHGVFIHRHCFEPAAQTNPLEIGARIREETRKKFNRDLRVIRAHHSGSMGGMILESCYTDINEQEHFEEAWYKFLMENGWLDELWSCIREGHNELWYSHP